MMLTKSQIKDLFKDRINWKFFNYLKDRITFLEDVGFKLSLHVDAQKKADIRKISIYVYDTNDNEHYVDNNIDMVDIDNLDLEYIIYTDTPAITYENKEKIESIWNTIKSKCELLYKSDSILIVIPKINI